MPDMTIVEAAEYGSYRDMLVALRMRISIAVQDLEMSARDLAPLSRRLQDISREIDALDSLEGDDGLAEAANTPDEAFDEAAI